MTSATLAQSGRVNALSSSLIAVTISTRSHCRIRRKVRPMIEELARLEQVQRRRVQLPLMQHGVRQAVQQPGIRAMRIELEDLGQRASNRCSAVGYSSPSCSTVCGEWYSSPAYGPCASNSRIRGSAPASTPNDGDGGAIALGIGGGNAIGVCTKLPGRTAGDVMDIVPPPVMNTGIGGIGADEGLGAMPKGII
jgi:hypothetical protein